MVTLRQHRRQEPGHQGLRRLVRHQDRVDARQRRWAISRKIGLPDIDSTNVTSIIGTSNGRGIYVIFDADGSIMQNFFGVGDNVLGISSPQFGITGTTIITESWTVLNGRAIDPADTNASTSRAWPPTSSDTRSAWRTPRPTVRRTSTAVTTNVGPNSCTSLPYATTP